MKNAVEIAESEEIALAVAGEPLEITPGRLIRLGETFSFQSPQAGVLTIRSGLAEDFTEIVQVPLAKSESWEWKPSSPGMYLAEWSDGVLPEDEAEAKAKPETIRRPLAVVEPGWAVCQITVGTCTAEDFAELIHGAGIGADYYVGPHRPHRTSDFSLKDPRWARYERQFGDAIYPHVMANDIGSICGKLGHEDANWDSLPHEGIVERLACLQQWWTDNGYRPLDRIASYTPSNGFVRACGEQGIRVLHSVVPEQNWSDGEWSINHWGMPTCPFWMAPDDFRKAGTKADGSVLAMTMNHYHVLLPHLTMWGDFVLSPSHFTRWNRAADSGESSIRFDQFLRETLASWSPFSDDPFFFSAGFEFGRTFGTANMTDYNRRGLATLIDLSRTGNLVFATGNDVRDYYDRHLPRHPETAFRQRDHWMGVTVNGKPGQAGDSLVVERRDYKAVIREGEYLPYFYYDYQVEWTFDTRDRHAPHDYAASLRHDLQATPTRNADGSLAALSLRAEAPLARTVPLGIWDAAPEKLKLPASFTLRRFPMLDDGRTVVLVEVPAGWSGEVRLALKPMEAPLTRRDDHWKMQSFGAPGERHTYVHLDAALPRPSRTRLTLKKAARVDSATGTLGLLPPGPLDLEFGLLQGWYRFWDCEVSDLDPETEIAEKPGGSEASILPGVGKDWQEQLLRHQQDLDHAAAAHIGQNETVLHQVHCGARLPFGTRSRAEAFDQVSVPHPTLRAYEKSDGVIAYAPGASFWYHPRGVHFRVEGLKTLAGGGRRHLLLNTFEPLGVGTRYKVTSGDRELPGWEIGSDPFSDKAFYKLEITARDFDTQGRLNIRLSSDQKGVLHWWKDKGYIAALHALWILHEEVEAPAP